MTITPEQRELGKGVFERRQQGFSSLLIGARGGEHFDGQQMALRVNEGVSFAPPKFFFSARRDCTRSFLLPWLRICYEGTG